MRLSSQIFRRSRVLVALSVAASLACVFAQLSTAAHMAFVQHEYCAQHGSWAHSEAHEHGSDAHDKTDERDAGPLAAVHNRSGSDHEHEHCHVIAERRDEWHNTTVDFVGVAPTFRDVVVDRISLAPLDLSATYWIAPKTSPPATVAV